MRKLASIRQIDNKFPIEGADLIETVQIDGWFCVAKKGEFQLGDKCVYFEIDSILPDTPWSAFMKDRKFRVKTAKFKGQISQGLALPMSHFYNYGLTGFEPCGEDLTELLGVRKHDPEGDREKAQENRQQSSNKPWWAKTYLGGKLWRWLHPKRGGWPEWLRKTDETRIQNLPQIDRMLEGKRVYATEKLDGQSITWYWNREINNGPFKTKGNGGVCSRNIHYPKFTSNDWWAWALREQAVEKLKDYCEDTGRSLAIQGELVGPSIRDNKYHLSRHEVYVYNVWDIDKQEYLPLWEKLVVLNELGLEPVPILQEDTSIIQDRIGGLCRTGDPENTRDFLLYIAEGRASLYQDVLREGIVVRDLHDDGFSFKAISNRWLLKYEAR